VKQNTKWTNLTCDRQHVLRVFHANRHTYSLWLWLPRSRYFATSAAWCQFASADAQLSRSTNITPVESTLVWLTDNIRHAVIEHPSLYLCSVFCLRQSIQYIDWPCRHNVFYRSVLSSDVILVSCEQSNEDMLLLIGTRGPWSKGMKRSTLGVKGQKSRADVRFGGLAETLFVSHLGSSGFSRSTIRSMISRFDRCTDPIFKSLLNHKWLEMCLTVEYRVLTGAGEWTCEVGLSRPVDWRCSPLQSGDFPALS